MFLGRAPPLFQHTGNFSPFPSMRPTHLFFLFTQQRCDLIVKVIEKENEDIRKQEKEEEERRLAGQQPPESVVLEDGAAAAPAQAAAKPASVAVSPPHAPGVTQN